MSSNYKQQPSADEQRVKTAELRKQFQETFDALGISDAYFRPKIASHFKAFDSSRASIKLWPSEMEGMVKQESDMYTMLVDWDWTPFQGEANLYKIARNPYYKQEVYFDGTSYYIPIEELIVVPKPKPLVSQAAIQSLTSNLDKDDCNLNALTGRDLASILLRTPQSNKQWLNELITNAH